MTQVSKPKCICTNCVFFHPGFRYSDGEIINRTEWGECRRRILAPPSDEARAFVPVHKEDWCGDFETKWWACERCRYQSEPTPDCPTCKGQGIFPKPFTELG